MASNCSLIYSSAPFSSTGRCAFWHVMVRATCARGRFRGDARSFVRVQRCQKVDWSVDPFAQANYRALTGRFALLVVDCAPIGGRLWQRFESVARARVTLIGKVRNQIPVSVGIAAGVLRCVANGPTALPGAACSDGVKAMPCPSSAPGCCVGRRPWSPFLNLWVCRRVRRQTHSCFWG
jgi:hypothetical protein